MMFGNQIFGGGTFGGTATASTSNGSAYISSVYSATAVYLVTGVGIAIGTSNLGGVNLTTSSSTVTGIGAMPSTINQIRAPSGSIRVWRDIRGNVITFRGIGV